MNLRSDPAGTQQQFMSHLITFKKMLYCIIPVNWSSLFNTHTLFSTLSPSPWVFSLFCFDQLT